MQMRNCRSVTGVDHLEINYGGRSLTELPLEIQSDILLRLPVKSLLFCKCVCKSFRAFISNPNFVQSHLNCIDSSPKSAILHFGQQEMMFYNTTRNPKISTLSIDGLTSAITESHVVFIIASCNGLVLIGARFGHIDKLDYMLILWNPVIGQHRYLPKPNYRYAGYHGFAFIPETNDYVVFRVSRIQKVIEVYKMSTDTWISIDCSSREDDLISKPSRRVNPVYFNGPEVEPVYLNGSFHWAEESAYDTDIVYYNLESEKVEVIKAIDYSRVCGHAESLIQKIRKKVVVVDNSLAMIYWDSRHTFPFQMWVMNDYGIEKTWTQRFWIQKDVSNRYVESYLAGLLASGLMIINERNRGRICASEVFSTLLIYDINTGSRMIRNRGRRSTSEVFNTLLIYDINTGSRMNIARMERNRLTTGFCNFMETLVPVTKGD